MKIFLSLAILLSSLVTVKGQWRTTTPFSSDLYDITFTDDYTGYATGQSGAIGWCSSYELSLYKTIDAGKNWIRIKTGTTEQIKAVHFANQMIGWTAGASSEILKTTDGGATWNQVSYGVGSGYNDIWFRDENNGFVLGNNGMLRKSNNGGNSWQTISSGVSVSLKRIHFYDNNLGFVVCSDGKLLRTTNGGATWSTITTGATFGIDVFFASSTKGYFIGSNSGSTNLYTTDDGGINWTSQPLGYSYLKKMFFTNESTGYIITGGYGVLKTIDGGVTWTQIETMNGLYDDWQGIHFTDDNTGYISGSNGRINKTTDGGQTWTNILSGVVNDLMAVEAPHKDTAYFGDIDGRLFKTENGGVNFKQLTPNLSSSITKMHFFNTQSGLAAVGNGTVLKTTNGGKNWIPQETNTTRRITDFSFINNQIGYASAFGGVIFKTTDAGVTWDSIPTGYDEFLTDIYFTNIDTGYAISTSNMVRTFDGGTTWDLYSPLNSGLMRDIKFYNDSIGYIVRSGKILISRDYGVTWELHGTNTSGTIYEMQLINDSTAYYTYNTSQRMSVDSGKTIYSQSTACLANNWSMFDLSMTNEGEYGYTVGGINGLVHQKEKTEIIATIVSTDAYCAGDDVFVAFLGKGFFNSGNMFVAQLSDASGSFANPTNIGAVDLTATLAYQSGVITASIPSGLPSGNGYRIRVAASNPSIVSPDNGFDISIQSSQVSSIQILASTNVICDGDEVSLSSQFSGGGLAPVFDWSINGVSTGFNSSNFSSDSLQNGDTLMVTMESSLNCVATNNVESNKFIIEFEEPLIVNLVADTTVCEGECFVLNPMVNKDLQSVYWSTSVGLNDSTVLTPTTCIIDSITYTAIFTDSSGCIVLDTINIWMNPAPETPLVTFDGTMLNSSLSHSYQWYFNNVSILGADSISYEPTQSGNYTVETIDSNGCSTISEEYNVVLTSINENKEMVKAIFPNPLIESSTIFLGSNKKENKSLIIIDVLGQEVLRFDNLKREEIIIKKQDLNSGVFYIYIKDNTTYNCNFLGKLVVQ